jgi:hypothetical protein
VIFHLRPIAANLTFGNFLDGRCRMAVRNFGSKEQSGIGESSRFSIESLTNPHYVVDTLFLVLFGEGGFPVLFAWNVLIGT